jgi:hypothetical protein
MKKAIVLLSGGLDSATTMLIAREQGFEILALSFDYGQRHRIEIERAKVLASRYGAKAHRVARLDFPAGGESALTDPGKAVPKDSLGSEAIPITYVPARNTLFLAHAVAWGEAMRAGDHLHRLTRSTTGLPRLPAGVPRGLRKGGKPRNESGRRGAAVLPDPRSLDRDDQGADRPSRQTARPGLCGNHVLL